MNERDLEDFQAGKTFGSGRIHIDADRIKSSAAEFDPQPFQLDERPALFVHGRPAFSGETHG